MAHVAVRDRIRRMIADELDLPESRITDDFRWLDRLGRENADDLIYGIQEAFTYIPAGFSLGSGHSPFDDCKTFDEISTAGALIQIVERHVAKYQL